MSIKQFTSDISALNLSISEVGGEFPESNLSTKGRKALRLALNGMRHVQTAQVDQGIWQSLVGLFRK